MQRTTSNIELRLDHVVNICAKIDEIVDSIPIDLPHSLQEKLKQVLLSNEKITDLVDGIKNRRPPRFLLVGRSGAGKSSLINALTGRYLAKTSDVRVGTTTAQKFGYTLQGKTLFEMIDTRGFSESTASPVDSTAEEQLYDAIRVFTPDAILFLKRCKERDGLNRDIFFLKKLLAVTTSSIPVFIILTQADEMAPPIVKEPSKYPLTRLDNIYDAEEQIRSALIGNGVKFNRVLSVSSLILWDKEPDKVPQNLWSELRIESDYRYQIDHLLHYLETDIDTRAAIFLMLATRMDEVTTKMSERLARVFATVAAAIATTPLPVSDLPILLALQSALVMMIAYLGGHELSFESAKKYLIPLSGMGAAGFTTQLLLQQSSKFLNVLFPGLGVVVSSGAASAATYALGRGAIALFINDNSDDSDLNHVVSSAREEYRENNATTGLA